MPFYFQPFSHSAVDPVNNVSVLCPRILPATLMTCDAYEWRRGNRVSLLVISRR